MNIYDGDPRLAIPQVITAFNVHRDRNELDEMLSVCTNDFRLKGKDHDLDIPTIRKVWGGMKETGKVFAHIRSGLHFVELTDTTASTIGMGLFYAAEAGEDGAPAMLDHPINVTEYHERFVKTDAGWKLQHRLSVETMRNLPPNWPKSAKR